MELRKAEAASSVSGRSCAMATDVQTTKVQTPSNTPSRIDFLIIPQILTNGAGTNFVIISEHRHQLRNWQKKLVVQ